MNEMTETEKKLAEIIWTYQPLKSSHLVKLCEEQLSWKKSTTYTMLKRLEKKGIFQNIEGIVTACLTREEYDSTQSNLFVDEMFEGSLPRFIASFVRSKKLSSTEVEELRALIDNYKE